MGQLLFGDFLAALRKRNRLAEADHYEQVVKAKFAGQLSDTEIMGLSVDGLMAILKITSAASGAAGSGKNVALQAYVADLLARGFIVSVGAEYREQL